MAERARGWLRVAGRTAVVLAGLACLSYLVDFGWLRWRFARHQDAFGQVTVKRFFAVPQKGGKEEYLEDDPRVETCVNSLFPHSAAPPCWYLNRHKSQRIDM